MGRPQSTAKTHVPSKHACLENTFKTKIVNFQKSEIKENTVLDCTGLTQLFTLEVVQMTA